MRRRLLEFTVLAFDMRPLRSIPAAPHLLVEGNLFQVSAQAYQFTAFSTELGVAVLVLGAMCGACADGLTYARRLNHCHKETDTA
jgi:hypothetical protein